MAEPRTAKTLADVFGPGIATCARQSFDEVTTGMRLRDAQEMLSAPPVAVAGDTPVICSSGAAAKELIELFEAQGMPVGSDLRPYRTEAEFVNRFAELISDGWRISAEYPQPTRVLPNESALNTMATVSYLNNKGHLPQLVSPQYLPRRVTGDLENIQPLIRQDTSWVLKAATDKANGGGLDIWIHQAGEPLERPDFIETEKLFVFEERLDLIHNWSIQQFIDPNGVVHLFGQTEQRIGPTGLFQGNRFGDISPVAPEFVAECRAIAARTAERGYRGFTAFDGGLTADGRVVIFDLNFRISAPSCPLLFLTGHRPDVLEGAAETVRWNVAEPLPEVLATVRPAVEAGHLMVTSGHDSRYTDDVSLARTSLFVMALGSDAGEATARRLTIESQLSLIP